MDSKTDAKSKKLLAPAVTRAAAVLELLRDEAEPQSLTDLARALRLPKSSLANICGALEESRLIQRTELGYALGPTTMSLGAAYLSSMSIVEAFHESIRRRPAEVDLTIHLAVPGEKNSIVILAQNTSRSPIQLAAAVGQVLPASTTAFGKAMLAEMATSDMEAALRGVRLPGLTALSVSDRRALDAELGKVRSAGYAIEVGQTMVGISSIAIAFQSDAGVASVGALGVSPKLDEPQVLEPLIAHLRAIKADLESVVATAE